MASRKLSVQKKIIIVALILIVCQVVFLLYHQSKEQPQSFKAVVDSTIAKQAGLSKQRQEQARIQLALADYMAKNNGKAPAALSELIPQYFPVVPIDPESGKPFAYRVENGRPIVGDSTAAKTVARTKQDQTTESGESEALSAEQQQILIASLTDTKEQQEFTYDPSGKRDPFRPFDFAPKSAEDDSKTPLERYDVSQLRLTAVLSGEVDQRALVENSAGRGFTVEKGTKIGTRNGQVVEILPDRILILENVVDFTGETKSNTVELILRTKDQEKRQP